MNNSINLRLWTKNFVLASSINFLFVLVFYMLVVVIAGYAIHELAASKAQAGLVAGLFIVGTLIGRLLIEQIIVLIGRKFALYLGLIGFIITSACYFIQSSIEVLLIIRLLHGFCMGIVSTIMGTLIAQIVPVTRRAEGIGYYSLSSTLGTAIGPFLGILLILHTSYFWIFALGLLISILAFICSFWLSLPTFPNQQANAIHPQSQSSFFNQLIEPKAVAIAAIVFICAICYSSILSFINFYAQQLQLEQAATLFFLVYAVAILISRPFTGRIMDHKGENIVMYPALALLSISLLILYFIQNGFSLLFSAALLGFGFGNMQSIAQAIAVKSTTLERMGLATSTFFIALDAGLGFGPFLLGFVLNYFSYAQMYILTGLIAATTIPLYYFLHGRKVN